MWSVGRSRVRWNVHTLYVVFCITLVGLGMRNSSKKCRRQSNVRWMQGSPFAACAQIDLNSSSFLPSHSTCKWSRLWNSYEFRLPSDAKKINFDVVYAKTNVKSIQMRHTCSEGFADRMNNLRQINVALLAFHSNQMVSIPKSHMCPSFAQQTSPPTLTQCTFYRISLKYICNMRLLKSHSRQQAHTAHTHIPGSHQYFPIFICKPISDRLQSISFAATIIIYY